MKTALFTLLFFLMSFQLSISQWQKMLIGDNAGGIYSYASNGNYLFAGKGDGVYLSTNNGSTWSQTQMKDDFVLALAVKGNYVFAGTDSYGVFVSGDNGATWSQTSLNNKSVNSLAVKGNYVFAGTKHGIYLSKDNGNSWKKTSMTDQIIFSLAADGDNIFAGTGNDKGLYVSTDNGMKWSRTSFTEVTVRSISISGKYIYAGTWTKGVCLSTNNGETWSETPLNIEYDHVYCSAAIGNYIFAGTLDNGIYVSVDNGTTWTQRNESLVKDAGDFQVMALCAVNDYLFGGTFRRSLAELGENKDSLVFTLKKTICYGKCPAYNMEIYKSGKINFEGKSDADKIGKFSKEIEKKEIEYLISEFEKSGFFDFENEYTSPITDLPTTYISFSNNNRFKTITDYYGAPKKLKDLELLLENIVKSDNWIKNN